MGVLMQLGQHVEHSETELTGQLADAQATGFQYSLMDWPCAAMNMYQIC